MKQLLLLGVVAGIVITLAMGALGLLDYQEMSQDNRMVSRKVSDLQDDFGPQSEDLETADEFSVFFSTDAVPPQLVKYPHQVRAIEDKINSLRELEKEAAESEAAFKRDLMVGGGGIALFFICIVLQSITNKARKGSTEPTNAAEAG